MARVTQLNRKDDSWILPLNGQEVTQLRLDYAVSLLTEGGYLLRIEHKFQLKDSDDASYLVAPDGDPQDLFPVLELSRTKVIQAKAFDDGRLELSFSSGHSVSVPRGDDFESWEIVGPGGFRMVSAPEGELVVWLPATVDSGDGN